MLHGLSEALLFAPMNLFMLVWWIPARDSFSQLKFVPLGPANFSAKPVVIHTDDLKNGINLPATISVTLSYPGLHWVSC